MFYQFYNTKTGTVMLEYTQKGTAAFGFARSTNPNISPNAITKGMKVYDYENVQYFSLTLDEALLIGYLLETRAKINTGTIVSDVKQTQPTQPNQPPIQYYEITVTHFPGTKEQKAQGMKSVSRLVIRLSSNLSGFISLYKDNFSCSVPFGVEGYFVLLSFVKNLPTFVTTLESLSTYQSIKQRESKEVNNNLYTQQVQQQRYNQPQNNTRPYSQPVVQDSQLPIPPLDGTADLLPNNFNSTITTTDENVQLEPVAQNLPF